ncbi:MAG: MMPL family transporter [Bacilli bacterium]|nr:MMPL family transporter [Bacilli bacterium]
MLKVLTYLNKKGKYVIVVFAALLVISLLVFPFVKITDDRVDYLPDSSEAKQGLVILNEEFSDVLKANGKVLIKNKTVNEILNLKMEIKKIPGVLSVIWIDDFVDLTTIPIEYIPENVRDNFYKDNKALFDITFTDEINSEVTKNAIREINTLLKDNGGVGLTPRSVVGVATLAIIVAVAIVVLVVVIFTDSFMASLLILVTLGVSIGINLGTNIIFGKISDITFIASSVIQLAVSIDYCLVFMKKLKDARSITNDLDQAIPQAMYQSLKTVLASSLTTIAGFLAIGIMKYRIGAELGLVLAKGVTISLISVILLLPVLVRLYIKAIDKTNHRIYIPHFKFYQRWIKKPVGIGVLVGLVLIGGFSFYFQNQNKYTYSDNQVEYTELEKEIVNTFGEYNQFILIIPNNEPAKEVQLLNQLQALETLQSVTSLYTIVPYGTPLEMIPPQVKAQFLSDNHSLIYITLDVPIESDVTFKTIDTLRDIVKDYYDTSYLTGESVVIYDSKLVIEEDYLYVLIASLVAIGLIVFFTFRKLTIPILLLIVIESAIWVNMAIPYFQKIEFAYLGYILISSIQLGATIDYAIIMTDNYLKERRSNSPIVASQKAFVASIEAIFVSILALIIAGFSLTMMMEMDLIRQLGILIGRGTIISGLFSLFILPQLLVLFDKLIVNKKLINEKAGK